MNTIINLKYIMSNYYFMNILFYIIYKTIMTRADARVNRLVINIISVFFV